MAPQNSRGAVASAFLALQLLASLLLAAIAGGAEAPEAAASRILDLIKDEAVWNARSLYRQPQVGDSTSAPSQPLRKQTLAQTASTPTQSQPPLQLITGTLKPLPQQQHQNTLPANKRRSKRAAVRSTALQPEAKAVDACQSQMEVITPYYARNSKGKLRVVVNSELMQQAIQVETCRAQTTNRCAGDCGCEQKYKWYRLLVHDPKDAQRGLFTDWFLFPSNCVCRCALNSATNFVRLTSNNQNLTPFKPSTAILPNSETRTTNLKQNNK